ncbi:unnamed protein product [Heterosigma akashiwo]
MTYFKDRTPGTYIENKQSSLTWHYADADPHFGGWQAKDMQMHMEDVLSNLPLEILQSNPHGGGAPPVREQEPRGRAGPLRHLARPPRRPRVVPPAAAELLPPEVDFVFSRGRRPVRRGHVPDREAPEGGRQGAVLKKGSTGDLEAASNKGQSAESFQEHADSNPDFWSNPSDPAAVGGPDGEAPAGGPDVGSGLGGSTGSGRALMALGGPYGAPGQRHSAADHNLRTWRRCAPAAPVPGAQQGPIPAWRRRRRAWRGPSTDRARARPAHGGRGGRWRWPAARSHRETQVPSLIPITCCRLALLFSNGGKFVVQLPVFFTCCCCCLLFLQFLL